MFHGWLLGADILCALLDYMKFHISPSWCLTDIESVGWQLLLVWAVLVVFRVALDEFGPKLGGF